MRSRLDIILETVSNILSESKRATRERNKAKANKAIARDVIEPARKQGDGVSIDNIPQGLRSAPVARIISRTKSDLSRTKLPHRIPRGWSKTDVRNSFLAPPVRRIDVSTPTDTKFFSPDYDPNPHGSYTPPEWR